MGIANIMESDEKLCAEVVAVSIAFFSFGIFFLRCCPLHPTVASEFQSEVFRVLVAITKLGANNEARKGATEQVLLVFLT